MMVCLTCEGICETEQESCSSCGTALLRAERVQYPVRRGEADASHPMLGMIVAGKYRITDVEAKGGMGTVFRAVHELSLVPVALKVLHPRFASREDYRTYFLAEARKAGRVRHEHTARILDVGEDGDGLVFIAQEFVEGFTLDEWIHGRERLAPSQVVDILHQICQALAVAHGVGLVHRDLSPRNVMVRMHRGRPFVKVLDFGIAKGGPLPLQQRARQEPAPPGWANPAYAAPEHLQGLEVDRRADLYSLGVIAFEALCGRLPAAGDGEAELAKATIEGRLRPMPPIAGVPSRLQRLITRLLALDPAQRPGHASEVQDELDHIRRPPSQLLRMVALVVFVASVTGFLLTHLGGEAPYLELEPGPLRMTAKLDTQPAPELRSKAMAELRLLYGGFPPERLELRAHRGGTPLVAEGLEPIAGPGGELVLSAAHSPGYAAFLATLADLSGPVVLTFGPRGRPPLGYARVLVDDRPPRVALDLLADAGEILNAATRLRLRVQDKGTVSRMEMTVAHRQGSVVKGRRVRMDPGKSELTVTLGELLAPILPGVELWRDVRLTLSARDRAGNRSEAHTAVLRGVDLAAPRILGVAGPRDARILLFGREGARLELTLDRPEAGLTLLVTPPGGQRHEIHLEGEGPELEFLLRPAERGGELPFVDGVYQFQLRDPAGNSSLVKGVNLAFRSKHAEAVLEPAKAPGAGKAVRLGRRLVVAGRQVDLAFSCNEIYRPVRISLVTKTGAAAEPGEGAARLLEIGPGRARVRLEGLARGAYRMTIILQERAGIDRIEESFDLRVLDGPVQIRLPDAGDKRFLPELFDLGLLALRGEHIVQGPSWSCVPDDWSLLQGRIWFGSPGNLVPRDLPPLVSERRSRLLRPLEPLRGENLLALELRDVLGRPVQVWTGSKEAPELQPGRGMATRLIARFFAHDQPIASVAELRVEYRQSTKLILRCRLPLRPQDDVELRVGPWRRPPRVSEVSGGCRLTFRLPFDQIMSASLGEMPTRAQFKALAKLRVAATLHTPAGDFPLELQLRAIASNLPPVGLRELASREDPLPQVLASIRMVPVLAPADAYPDPVPLAIAGRADFRPQPPIAVSNLHGLYLQQSEFTRAQYAAVIAAFQALPRSRRGDWRVLVHATDPLREHRLEALVPLLEAADPAQWRRLVALGPLRPVTGVSFHQAYTIARLLGLLVARDPELLRLPTGVELEVAALGRQTREGLALNGATAKGPPQSVAAWRAADTDDLARWPPTSEESAAHGDLVRTELGDRLLGLDFGVREWVLDLPFVGSERMRVLLRQWLADQEIHLAKAVAVFQDPGMAEVLDPEIVLNGVVRGLAFGELEGLVDAATGRRLQDHELLNATVPGVVRTLVLPRSGSGLVDLPDPRLRVVGFRLAGGSAFVARVRAR